MEEKITALIVDDESRARTLLREMLKEYCPEVEVIADCADLPNGVKLIQKHKPMLVFLDIEMPGHSGLELLDFFNEEDVDFSIIFTTAYHEYAIQAFKLSAVDYLLKPIEQAELENSVHRFKKRKAASNLPQLRQMLKQNTLTRVAVPVGSSVKFLEPLKIIYLKADNTYTEIMMEDGTKIVASRILKNFEEALHDNPAFFRCHKSYVVNLNFVSEYSKSDGGFLVAAKKFNIPISPDKLELFLEKVNYIKR